MEKGKDEPEFDRIFQNAPAKEPERQYYFIEQAKKIVAKQNKALGRRQKMCCVTFGCQMNARDSEKLRGILENIGFEKTEEEEDADFIIYNTCTVRENANQKVYGRLGYLHSLKKKRPSLMIALCGCMMQEPEVVEKLKKSYRFVNLVFGTHNIYKLAELMAQVLANPQDMVIDIWKDTDRIVENLPVDRKYSFKSGVNIMFGCNNFCSYCIVPYVRGRERSRKPEEILAEIRRLAADGVREIMLLGQNVNSYGKNLEHPMTFAELLEQVSAVEGVDRIRFMTSHPKDLSDELIRVMASHPNICPHLHLPVQSGSSRILKEMNRRYTKEQYLALVGPDQKSHAGYIADHRYYRRLPRGDGRGFPGDSGCGGKGSLRQRIYFYLFQTDRYAGGCHGKSGARECGKRQVRPASEPGTGYRTSAVCPLRRQNHGCAGGIRQRAGFLAGHRAACQ